jgi:AraC-like DNA-binding protein
MVVPPGTTKGWVTPSAAQPGAILVIHGGFTVDDGRTRHLERRARTFGFDDLRSHLQARCDTGVSIPALAQELGVSDWTVKQALHAQGVVLPPRPQRLARQRRRYTDQRIAARVAELGFADVRAYLADRLVARGWLLADVTAELGAHRVTVRRLLDQHGIRRGRRTASELAAGERGRQVQSVSWQARRAARLAELGFPDLAAYLRAGMWSRAGRSSGCGRSFGSAAAGCWPSWHGLASSNDQGHRRGIGGAPRGRDRGR